MNYPGVLLFNVVAVVSDLAIGIRFLGNCVLDRLPALLVLCQHLKQQMQNYSRV